jgi:hypothetical protein
MLFARGSPTLRVEETRVLAALNAKKKPADTTSTRHCLAITATATAIAAFERRRESRNATTRNINKPDTVRVAHARSWP